MEGIQNFKNRTFKALTGLMAGLTAFTYILAPVQAQATNNQPDMKTAGAFSSMGSSIGLNMTGSAVSCMSRAGVLAALEEYNLKAVDSEEKIAEYVNAYKNVAIAKVNNYVNVRKKINDGKVVGKLYNESMGTIIDSKKGWYKIKSGNVTGWIKKDYVVTGEEARQLAKKVGTRVATVKTTTLRVRQKPSEESKTLTMVPQDEKLNIIKESDKWLKVTIDEDIKGWISRDFVDISTEFKKAETYKEEIVREEREARERVVTVDNNTVIRPYQQRNNKTNKKKNTTKKNYTAPSGYGKGADVASYALRFVGNRYKYGGTSLTNGTDCSGFTKGVYAKFGVSLPRTSSSQRSAGKLVCYGWDPSKAKAGDIVCYNGHVAIYIGGGRIVHASNRRDGIKVSNKVNYRTVRCVRRIF